MSPRSNPRAHHRRHFSFYILHRYLGLLAALFVLLLAITGIMLNHTETLRMDEQKINTNLVLNWYGINADIPAKGYRVGQYWISNNASSMFLNKNLLNISLAELTGAVKAGELLVISGREKVALLTDAGELIDVIDRASGLPDGNILRLGFSKAQQVVLETDNGVFASSSDFLSWKNIDTAEIEWARAEKLPAIIQTTMAKSWRGEGVTLERLILDLHSGRLLGGNWGVLLMDLVALIMIFLAFTGVWLWVIRWHKRRVHNLSYKRHHKKALNNKH